MLEAERINAISSQMYEQSIHEDKRGCLIMILNYNLNFFIIEF